MTPKQFKDECIAQTDQLIKLAPSAPNVTAPNGPPPPHPGYVEIGDGITTYTVLNTKEVLLAFRKRLSRLPVNDKN